MAKSESRPVQRRHCRVRVCHCPRLRRDEGTDKAALIAEEAVLMAAEEAQALAHGLPDLRGAAHGHADPL